MSAQSDKLADLLGMVKEEARVEVPEVPKMIAQRIEVRGSVELNLVRLSMYDEREGGQESAAFLSPEEAIGIAQALLAAAGATAREHAALEAEIAKTMEEL